MQLLLDEIQEDINWRISEISNIKTIPVRYNLQNSHKQTLILYSIPSLYSIWEGYVKNTFELLTKYINTKSLRPKTVHPNILTHAVENECNLGNRRKEFSSKKSLVESSFEIYNSPLVIKQGIPTESNVNYKVVNNILERFNILNIDDKFKRPLDKLLFFRNTIAHGENSIKVSSKDVYDFSLLIQNLMFEILILIENYIKNKKYLKTNLSEPSLIQTIKVTLDWVINGSITKSKTKDIPTYPGIFQILCGLTNNKGKWIPSSYKLLFIGEANDIKQSIEGFTDEEWMTLLKKCDGKLLLKTAETNICIQNRQTIECCLVNSHGISLEGIPHECIVNLPIDDCIVEIKNSGFFMPLKENYLF